MKIVSTFEEGFVAFKLLKAGTCFLFRDKVYIKTEDIYDDEGYHINTVNPEDGYFGHFEDEDLVFPLPDAFLTY